MSKTPAPSPEDFEPGEVVDMVIDSKNLTTVVSVRFSGEDLAVVEAAASLRGQKLSTFVRAAAVAMAQNRREGLPTQKAYELIEVLHSKLDEAKTDLDRMADAG